MESVTDSTMLPSYTDPGPQDLRAHLPRYEQGTGAPRFSTCLLIPCPPPLQSFCTFALGVPFSPNL